MYIILMNKDKSLTTSKRVDLYEGDNLADKIRFLFPEVYNGINLDECVVRLNYRDVIGEERSEILVKDTELYKNRLSYRYPIDSKFTEFYGDILFNISFSVTDDTDGDGTTENVLFHTESHVIAIKPRPNSIAPDEIIPEDSASKILKEVHNLEERIEELEKAEVNVDVKDVVKYVKQELTENQKEQARINIGAIDENNAKEIVKNNIVQGNWNIIDDENKYIRIIGNGVSDDDRSNAHTLDKQGNAEYQGDVIAKGCGGENPISLVETWEKVNSTMTEYELVSFLSEIELVYPFVDSDNKMFIDNNNNIYIL